MAKDNTTSFTLRLHNQLLAIMRSEQQKRQRPFTEPVPLSALHREALIEWAQKRGYDVTKASQAQAAS